MKNFVSTVTIIVTFFTSIFLSESYLSYTQVNASLICRCNHSSHNEIHSNKDSLLLNEHVSLLEIKKNLPSCHSSNKVSAHICSCKKTSENLVHILFQKVVNIMNILKEIPIEHFNLYYISITLDRFCLHPGFSFLITPPPKSTI